MARVNYTGSGAGDVTITATMDNINSNSVTVEDCISYTISSDDFDKWTCSFTEYIVDDYYCFKNNSEGNLININLPERYKVTFDYYGGGDPCSAYLTIGTDNNNCYIAGMDSGNRRIRIYSRINGANNVLTGKDSCYLLNTWQEVTVIFTPTTLSISLNDNTLEVIPSENLIDGYLGLFSSGTNARIKNLKVKPYTAV